MSNIAEKLTTIAENQQRVYDAGFTAGQAQGGGGSDYSNEDGLVTRTITEYSNDRITTVGAYAFRGLSSLQKVYFPNVKKIGGSAFDGCENLTEVRIPCLEEIIGAYAFCNCKSLVSIDLPMLFRQNDMTFSGCSSLENVNLPLVTYVGSSSFANCTALKEIHLPSVNMFYTTPFNGCSNLEKAEFDTKITFSRATLFKNCNALTALILRANELSSLTIGTAFNECGIANGTGYIYVPRALIEEYKVATNWVVYASQFRAIEDYPEICGGAE